LEFYNLGHESRLLVSETKHDVAEVLGISGAEAIGLLNELDTDGYLRLNYGPGGPYAGAGLVMVNITDKGRAEMQRAIPVARKNFGQ
jgi:hypothetical protein